MPWTGRKKVAFLPVFRTITPPSDGPDVIPPDWPGAILSRILYHPDPARRTYGFHHWARFSHDFDAEVASLQASGWTEAFYDELPSGSRVMYLDPNSSLPGLLELVEHTPTQAARYAEIHRTAIDWDGTDPVRREN